MGFEKGKGKEHLDKDFLEELKHKIWSTKGIRFGADTRLKDIAYLSNLSNSFLSAYLIIFGLIALYNLSNPVISEELVAFTITALSILSLVFSLIENSQGYSLRARSFHDCALDLSDMYNELQNFKTYRKDATEQEKMAVADDLQKSYQQILRKYENHMPIDREYFLSKQSDYYGINKSTAIKIKIEYFIRVKLFYILLIILPPIILSYLICQ